MPTTYDNEFIEGFDKYGPPAMTYPSFAAFMLQGEWNALPSSPLGGSIHLATPPDGARGAAYSHRHASQNVTSLYKTLSNDYARIIGGASQTYNFAAQQGGIFALYDSGSMQISIWLNNIGQIVVCRGTIALDPFGNIYPNQSVWTSHESVGASSSHYFEWDITVHPTAGIIKIWLDGVLTSIDHTGVNTSGTGSSKYNGIGLPAISYAFAADLTTWDHLYTWHYITSGSGDTPLLTNPVVETQFPNSDSTVAFTAEHGVLGEAFSYSGTYDPIGPNTLILMRFTPDVNMTLTDVSFLPNTTSGTAKFKAVAYSDSGGLPTTLLSDGVEKIAVNAGIIQKMQLASPPNLTAGTPYWIGFYSDTAMNVLRFNDVDFTAVAKANTYGSGAVATITSPTTGLRPYMIYGNCDLEPTNYTQVTNTLLNPPLGDIQYNDSDTIGAEDLFGFPPLSLTTANVYTVAVKIYMRRAEAGYRLMDAIVKSATTESSGSAPAQAPPASYGWVSSYFDVDPNTSTAWTPTTVNAALSGYKINA